MTHSYANVDTGKTRGLHYVGKSEGDAFDLFHYLADGDSQGNNSRPVLEVLVDRDNKIYIAAIHTAFVPSIPLMTKGVAHRHTNESLEAIGIDTEHVCLGSVMRYVVPRIATLMARVYCPNPAPSGVDPQ